MAQYTEYHPLKFWLDPASIAEIVAHIQTYLVNNPINSTTEIETIIHDYLIAHPELIGGVKSVNGETGEVVLTADNISAGESVTIKDVLDSLQDQINDIVISIPSDYQQLINDVSDLKSNFDDCFYKSTGKNRVNDADFVSGYLKSDGSLAQYGDWMTTGYCDVKGLSNIVGSRSLVGESSDRRYTITLFFLCSYDENKTFIEQINLGSAHTWAVASGVSFVRFSFHSNTDENIMLESGTVPTMPFEPYTVGLKLYDVCSPLIWKGKKWAVIGDSLTEVNTRTAMHYYDYIARKTGITVINMGVSGTGYARGQDTSNAFYQRASSVPTDADVVTIFGSFNDLGAGIPIGTVSDTGTTTIAGCINTTIDNLQTAIPLINLGIVAPTPWMLQQPETSGNAYEYVEMLKDICEHRSIPFLDLWRCSNLRPWDSAFRAVAYSKDEGNGTHPDENGHALIAPRFEAFLDSLLLH